MFGINLRHSLATLAFAAGLLATAGSASAATPQSGVVAYNGHAGLGASSYQHNQTDLEFVALSPRGTGSKRVRLGSHAAGVTDGTSNTIAFAERAARPRGFSIDIGTSENIAADGLGADDVPMTDVGGHSGPPGIVTDNKDPDKKAGVHRAGALVFSGDAYDNEMGLTTEGDAHDDANAILMADMGGQFARTGPSADAIIAVLIGL